VIEVINRTVKIKLQIGSWDMDTVPNLNIPHGLGENCIKIRSIFAIIISDLGNHEPILFMVNEDSVSLSGGFQSISTSTFSLMRAKSLRFDSTSYNDTAINRGDVQLEYEV